MIDTKAVTLIKNSTACDLDQQLLFLDCTGMHDDEVHEVLVCLRRIVHAMGWTKTSHTIRLESSMVQS